MFSFMVEIYVVAVGPVLVLGQLESYTFFNEMRGVKLVKYVLLH